MTTKKIVITGIGATTPIGGTARESWKALLAGESGARPLEHEWVAQYELPVTFAASVKVDPSEVLERTEIKRLDPSSQFALIAAREAWADAGAPDMPSERLGVDYATGIGGVWTLLDAWDTLREKGPRRVLPMTVPMLMPNAAAGIAISMHLGARAYARTVASACASSTESLVNAYEHLQAGLADVVIAGGSEAAIHPITVAAFSSMQALSRRNDDPATASRPYDVDRDGFVMGEGAAALVLETEEHAKARGARIYGELVGYGSTADAYRITDAHPEGRGAAKCLELTLADAGWNVSDVNYINAHGTSTGVNDKVETLAIKRACGEQAAKIPISSTKSMLGHLIAAAGATELMICLLSIRDNVMPPTINYETPDPECDLDYIPNQPREVRCDKALTNSFGFGGQNVTLAVSRFTG